MNDEKIKAKDLTAEHIEEWVEEQIGEGLLELKNVGELLAEFALMGVREARIDLAQRINASNGF